MLIYSKKKALCISEKEACEKPLNQYPNATV